MYKRLSSKALVVIGHRYLFLPMRQVLFVLFNVRKIAADYKVIKEGNETELFSQRAPFSLLRGRNNPQ
jgi:hypothetical protein